MPTSDQHARLRAAVLTPTVLTPPVLTVRRYAASTLVVAASTVTGWFAFGASDLADAVMVVLLGVAVVSLRFGYGPSLLAATLSAIASEFVFLPPYFSLAIAGLHHIVTFGVMLTIALVISHLTQRPVTRPRRCAAPVSLRKPSSTGVRC